MTFTISTDASGLMTVAVCTERGTPVQVYIDSKLVYPAPRQPLTAELQTPGKPNPFYAGLVRAKKRSRVR